MRKPKGDGPTDEFLRRELGRLSNEMVEQLRVAHTEASRAEAAEKMLQAAHVRIATLEGEKTALIDKAEEDDKNRHASETRWGDRISAAERAAKAASNESAATLKQFYDLKTQLAGALAEAARLRGFIERVHEQDRIAAGKPPVAPDAESFRHMQVAADNPNDWVNFGSR